MEEKNKVDLEKLRQQVIDNIKSKKNLTNDEKMLSIVYEMGMFLSKNVEFFYHGDLQRQNEIYENYKKIENCEVICRSVVHLYSEMAKELGLNCYPLEIENDMEVKFNHWALVYENDNKKYLINPIPDFYRIQMGFSLRSFCWSENYHGIDKMSFDSMSAEYIKEMATRLGYLKSGIYTDDLLSKLSIEMTTRMGTNIVRTSDVYQDYYLTLLELIQDDTKSLDEKLEKLKTMDDNYDKHKDILIEAINKKKIDTPVRKAIHETAFKNLLNTDPNLDVEREGARYIGSMDITKFKKLKNEMMIYKFNYMFRAIPSLTTSLTGFIENKNFMDQLEKYIFTSGEERSRINRHTVYKENNGNKEYFMMYSLKLDNKDNSSLYCFYDQNEKKVELGIEPVKYMLDHDLKSLKESSLNLELLDIMENSTLVYNPRINNETRGKIA